MTKLSAQKRWAVFVSGRGSNMHALLDFYEANQVALIVSHRASAPALKKALRSGCSTWIMPKENRWEETQKMLLKFGVTHIFLLGFMQIVPADFLKSWKGRIFNLHPSLLPAYPGKDAWQRAFTNQDSLGVSIHHVTEGVDEGAVIKQMEVLRSPWLSSMNMQKAQLCISWGEQFLVRRFYQHVSSKL